jgi:hypothetical protein
VYTLRVVVVEIRSKRISLVLERNAPVPEVSDAFCLDSSVEPFDVSIVIGTMKPSMSGLNAIASENLFKVPTVLWAIVALYHSERKTKDCLGIQDGPSG